MLFPRIKEFKCPAAPCACRVAPNIAAIDQAMAQCARGRSCGMRDVKETLKKTDRRQIITLPKKNIKQDSHLTSVPPPVKPEVESEDILELEIKDPISYLIKPNGKIKHR